MPKISEEKRKARQLRILDAATACFARDGFHRTSMEDIVKESGLSPGAIYCYFRGKHEIVEAIAVQRHARDSALLKEFASAPTVREGLECLCDGLIRLLNDSKERERRKVSIQFWAESLLDKQVRKIADRGLRQRHRLLALLREAQNAGELPAGLDVKSISRVMLALLQGLILQLAWEPELDVEAYARTATALIGTVFSCEQTRAKVPPRLAKLP
ncbi:MAG: TetR/AcrR family transcriptional regulator [Acidobacteriia bacterium]|nr:TetR/AcrR family transcriptional regulator [Terriglobia bacterium]